MCLGPKEVVSNHISPMFHEMLEAPLSVFHLTLGYRRTAEYQITSPQSDILFQETFEYFQTINWSIGR